MDVIRSVTDSSSKSSEWIKSYVVLAAATTKRRQSISLLVPTVKYVGQRIGKVQEFDIGG